MERVTVPGQVMLGTDRPGKVGDPADGGESSGTRAAASWSAGDSGRRPPREAKRAGLLRQVGAGHDRRARTGSRKRPGAAALRAILRGHRTGSEHGTGAPAGCARTVKDASRMLLRCPAASSRELSAANSRRSFVGPGGERARTCSQRSNSFWSCTHGPGSGRARAGVGHCEALSPRAGRRGNGVGSHPAARC